MRENDRLLPVSPYGAGKLGIESYAHVYYQTFGVPSLCVRLYPMYGPRQKKQVVYDLMSKLMQDGNKLKVYGTGKEERDFLYVEDAALGLEKIIRKIPFTGTVINLCTGTGVPISIVVRIIMDVIGSKKEVVYSQKMRNGDVDKMIGSCELLKKTGFKPKHTFKEGIAKTAEWFLSVHKSV